MLHFRPLKMTNYTAGKLSWAPDRQFEGQFEQIKGIIIFLATSFIMSGLIILKLIRLYAKTKSSPKYFDEMQTKILEMESSLDELTTFTPKPTYANIDRPQSFDPHICYLCPPTSICPHDVCDGGSSGSSGSSKQNDMVLDSASEIDHPIMY